MEKVIEATRIFEILESIELNVFLRLHPSFIMIIY